MTWHPLTVDPAGIRYEPIDAAAAHALAVLPGKSATPVETEATLLQAGLRPLRNVHGLIVGILTRDGQIHPYTPDVEATELV